MSTPVLLQWEGATLTGLPAVYQPEQSLLDDDATLLLDAETGWRIAHWAETDYLTYDQDDPVIILRPAVPLPNGHRVIVAARGLLDALGDEGPAYVIDSIEEDPDSNIAVLATGHITVPSFLGEADAWAP